MAGHFLLVLLVKIWTSVEFRNCGHLINKIIHVIENVNYAKPYVDWDEGKEPEQVIPELQYRFRATCIEMAVTFCVNLISTALMLVPLWYTGEFGRFSAILKYLLNILQFTKLTRGTHFWRGSLVSRWRRRSLLRIFTPAPTRSPHVSVCFLSWKLFLISSTSTRFVIEKF